MTSQSATTILEEGAVLGDLRLVRQIGRGAQGVVFEAVQTSMGRRVAVKILPGEATFGEEQIARFRREAGAAGRLNHRNAVSVYGFEQVGGHFVLIQELVTGGSLEDALAAREQAGRTDTPEHVDWCVDVVRAIAWGLQHAHEEDVVHRDIKPGNILMTEDGTPKLADFGLAKVEDELGLSMTGAVLGTPHYMSPEQVAGRRAGIDHRTDIYSLGALLYRMLTGVVPLDGDTRQGLFLDIMTRAPLPPRRRRADLSSDLDAVCLKALEKSVDDRYATARDFAEDLARTRLGESTVARPLGPTQRAWRSVRRLATSSLVLFVFVVPLAWWVADLWLRGWVAADPARHDVRLALVVTAALLLAAPLSVLVVRLGAGRAWLRPLGLAAALGLGAAGAWVVREQQLDAFKHIARADLAASVEQQRRMPDFAVPNKERIDAMIDAWAPRFDDADRLLVARALLVAERPVEAERWVREAFADGDAPPLGHALDAAIAGSFARDEREADALARLAAALDEQTDADQHLAAGDVFADVGRYLDARALYLAGGRVDGTDRNRVELALADVAIRMCRWDDAREHLTQYRKWNDDDAASSLLAYQLAQERGDAADAAEALRRVRRLAPASMVLLALEAERAGLRDDTSHAISEEAVRRAHELYRRARAEHPDDIRVLAWCARGYLVDSQALRSLRAEASYAEDTEAFERWDAELRAHHDHAMTLFGSISARAPQLSIGPVGLAGVELERARFARSVDDQRDHRRAALDHARRAVELDPGDWHGHHNLYLAKKYLAFDEHSVSSAADLPLAVVEDYLVDLRAAIAANGVAEQALNHAAYTLSYIYDDTGDAAALDEAIGYAVRAVRIVDRDADGIVCPRDGNARLYASSIFDTARELMELAGRRAEALVYAQRAVDALRPGDQRYDRRLAALAALQDGADDDEH